MGVRQTRQMCESGSSDKIMIDGIMDEGMELRRMAAWSA